MDVTEPWLMKTTTKYRTLDEESVDDPVGKLVNSDN